MSTLSAEVERVASDEPLPNSECALIVAEHLVEELALTGTTRPILLTGWGKTWAANAIAGIVDLPLRSLDFTKLDFTPDVRDALASVFQGPSPAVVFVDALDSGDRSDLAHRDFDALLEAVEQAYTEGGRIILAAARDWKKLPEALVARFQLIRVRIPRE